MILSVVVTLFLLLWLVVAAALAYKWTINVEIADPIMALANAGVSFTLALLWPVFVFAWVGLRLVQVVRNNS